MIRTCLNPWQYRFPGCRRETPQTAMYWRCSLPGGLAYEAEGTYSGISSRAVDPQSLITDPMKIYLRKAGAFP
jgi:hypothetical protein